MAGFSNGSGGRRRGLLTFSLVAALATIAAGMLLWQASEHDSLASVSARVDRMRPLTSGLRLGLIAVLALFWPRLVCSASRTGLDRTATRARGMALRWRVLGWLLVIELVVGQNLLGRLISWVDHPA
jgi:hypothetical protein